MKGPKKIIEILQLSDDIKKKISFIDLSGGDTDEKILNK